MDPMYDGWKLEAEDEGQHVLSPPAKLDAGIDGVRRSQLTNSPKVNAKLPRNCESILTR
jgi:hypothetical protein